MGGINLPGKRTALFFFFIILGVVLFLEPVKQLIDLSFKYDPLYSHIPLIPLISLYLLFEKRKAIFGGVSSSYKGGIPFLALAIVLFWIGNRITGINQNDYLSVMMLGAFTWFIGSFILVYGIGAFKKGAFSLLFLVFMIPIPTIILDPFILFLQVCSAHVSFAVFKLLGVPVFREGFLFSLPGVTVEVAKQCSGIRSSLALFITSILAGYLFLQTGRRRVLFALSVFPITIFKNALRIVTVSLLASYVDLVFITDHWIHSSGGVPFFVVALITLVPVLWILRRGEGKEDSPEAMAIRQHRE